MIELTFLKELMLIKQGNQMRVIVVNIGIFLNKGFKFQTHVCNRCHDLLMMSVNLSDIAVILKVKSAGYFFIISGIHRWGHKLNAKYRFDRKKWNIIKHKSLFSHIKMCEEILLLTCMIIIKLNHYI